MTPQEAIQKVQNSFHFEGYIEEDLERYLAIINPVLRYLHPPAKLLDFGGGPGEKTAMFAVLGFACTIYDDLQDYWHGWKDNRQKILDFAREMRINYVVADDRPMPFKPEEFDLVMMHGVLEHLHDSPRNLLNVLLTLLKPGGVFYATVPNAVNLRKRVDVLRGRTNGPLFESYYWSPDPWRQHVREYVRDDFVQLAAFLDLEILELSGCHQMLGRLSPGPLRRIYLALSAVFPDLRDTWIFLARKKPGWVPKPITTAEQYHILYKKNPGLKKMLEQGAFSS